VRRRFSGALSGTPAAISGHGSNDMGQLLDKLKGKAKQMVGAITGDRSRQVEGAVDEEKGKLKEKYEDVKRDIRPPE
jgi:uncharacterized protein YjbJ (UPF0337 family)